jgi:hypothetical protein
VSQSVCCCACQPGLGKKKSLCRLTGAQSTARCEQMIAACVCLLLGELQVVWTDIASCGLVGLKWLCISGDACEETNYEWNSADTEITPA